MRFFCFHILLTLFFTATSTTLSAQGNIGKMKLEINPARISLVVGPYRGRTSETNDFFNQGLAAKGQIYFPFQLSIDYKKNYTDSFSNLNEYNNRIFLIRPAAILHYVNNGSYAFGLGCQFSWLLFKVFYIEYQIGGIYLEATQKAAPDLSSGFNLHHYVSFSKPLSKNISAAVGVIHLSGAHLSKAKGSNQDVITIGITYSF